MNTGRRTGPEGVRALRRTNFAAAASVALSLSLFAPVARATVPDVYDRPMSQVWTARRAWDAQAEREFGEFVAAIGRGVAEHRCGTLSRCLNNARVNPLHVQARRPLNLHADCGDVPYTLRAYFACRKGLPFMFARDTLYAGRDRRYASRVRPAGQHRWTDFHTPRALFNAIASAVDSGFYRMATTVANSDTYPTRVVRGAVHPGTVYYNPNGHVLIVWRIDADGTVHMIDGHPDNSITYRTLNDRYPHGSRSDGGGFRNWRPLVGARGERYAANSEIHDIADEQYDRRRWTVAGLAVPFQRWVRARLIAKGP
jgi:hypothetical protein